MKTRKGLAPILATLILITITLTAALGSTMITPDNRGTLIPMVGAIENNLVKEVGDLVNFKAKIKNTGNQESKYLIVVLWKEHEVEEWEQASIEDIVLAPDLTEHIELGSIECTPDMAGKMYDVQFILYDAETENLLDKKTIEMAWSVTEPIVAGSIIGHWIF
jgi:flagellin-like protein